MSDPRLFVTPYQTTLGGVYDVAQRYKQYRIEELKIEFIPNAGMDQAGTVKMFYA